jgi:lipopolysaccharide biosynthesis glycosyltransferase
MESMLNCGESVAVVCAADDNYAMPLAVTLCSVIKNFKSDRRLELFVIDGGIEEKNKQKIASTLESQQVDLHFVEPNDMLLADLPLSKRFTVTIYYRLLVAELLADHFSKVIYLDSDVVVRGNLAEL